MRRHFKTHRSKLPFHCTYCTDRFSDNAIRQSHEEICPNRQFKCTYCDFQTTESVTFTTHKQSHAGERHFTCDICSKAFRLKHHLTTHIQTHWRTHSSVKKYQCDICAKEFAIKSNLNVHIKYHKGEKPFACQQCTKCFVHKGDLNRHIKTHDNSHRKQRKKTTAPQHIVEVILKEVQAIDVHSEYDESSNCADSLYHNFKREDEHKFKVEDEIEEKYSPELICRYDNDDDDGNGDGGDIGEYKFDDCNGDLNVKAEQFSETEEEEVQTFDECLGIKEMVCTKNEPEMADNNDEKYATSMEMTSSNEHIKRRSASSSSPSSPTASAHAQAQAAVAAAILCQGDDKNTEKKFICDICTKRFRLKHHLLIHFRTHTGQKNYQCEICSKRFKQGSHLSLHLKIHSGERKFGCQFCERRFTFSADLQRHFKIHREQLPFECDACSRRFSDQNALDHHETNCRTKKTQFKCQMCDYITSVNSRFKTHMKSHAKREFQCTICDKHFIYKHNLQNHLKVHSNERSFLCDCCSKTFRLNAHLQRHLKKVHKK